MPNWKWYKCDPPAFVHIHGKYRWLVRADGIVRMMHKTTFNDEYRVLEQVTNPAALVWIRDTQREWSRKRDDGREGIKYRKDKYERISDGVRGPDRQKRARRRDKMFTELEIAHRALEREERREARKYGYPSRFVARKKRRREEWLTAIPKNRHCPVCGELRLNTHMWVVRQKKNTALRYAVCKSCWFTHRTPEARKIIANIARLSKYALARMGDGKPGMDSLRGS